MTRIATQGDGTLDTPNPRICLPANIYCAVDRELNLFYDALLYQAERDNQLQPHIYCNVGSVKDRRFKYAPAAAPASNALTANVYDRQGTLIKSKAITMLAVAKNAGSGAKKLLFIGDSLTYDAGNARMISEVNTLITADGGISATMIGTMGTNPNKNEGRGGWTFYKFTNDVIDSDPVYGVNPFYFHTITVSGISVTPTTGAVYSPDGGTTRLIVKATSIAGGSGTITFQRSLLSTALASTGTWTKISGTGDSSIVYTALSSALSFSNYWTVNGNTGNLDFAFIQLGTNDIGGYYELSDSSADTIITYAKALCATILAHSPSCMIVIALPPICANIHDGTYLSGTVNFNGPLFRSNMRLLWEKLITNFDASAYSANVSLSINGLMIDRTYGYVLTTEAASARESTTITVPTDGIHLSDSGYKQAADAFYNVLRKLLS